MVIKDEESRRIHEESSGSLVFIKAFLPMTHRAWRDHQDLLRPVLLPQHAHPPEQLHPHPHPPVFLVLMIRLTAKNSTITRSAIKNKSAIFIG